MMLESQGDDDLVQRLIGRWHETRDWAERLLMEQLDIEHPSELLGLHLRGIQRMGNTDWWFKVHGVGVDVYKKAKKGNVGGIDFDFDKGVNPWRLRIFLVKQVNGGGIPKHLYRPLLEDQARWEAAVGRVLGS